MCANQRIGGVASYRTARGYLLAVGQQPHVVVERELQRGARAAVGQQVLIVGRAGEHCLAATDGQRLELRIDHTVEPVDLLCARTIDRFPS